MSRLRGSWVAAAALGAAIGVTSLTAMAARPESQAPNAETIKRGNYLLLTAGCHDCHTPMKMGAQGPEPDMSLALSGHPAAMQLPPPPAPSGPWIASIAATMTAWAGPWGISYTANLTPDKETGLGNYTEAQFIQTIRDGKKQGRGRALLPPMPWPMYRNFTDEDLKAIFAYLQSVKPIKNKVPDPVVAEPK